MYQRPGTPEQEQQRFAANFREDTSVYLSALQDALETDYYGAMNMGAYGVAECRRMALQEAYDLLERSPKGFINETSLEHFKGCFSNYEGWPGTSV